MKSNRVIIAGILMLIFSCSHQNKDADRILQVETIDVSEDDIVLDDSTDDDVKDNQPISVYTESNDPDELSDTSGDTSDGSDTDTPVQDVSEGDETNGEGSEDENTPLAPLFSLAPGSKVSAEDISNMEPDQTGLYLTDDYDGDGISNQNEVISNPYVADYPRVLTRIAPPITMEIRVSQTSVSENHSETVEDSDVEKTIEKSMESQQYSQLNEKTTPVDVSYSQSTEESHSEEFARSESQGTASSQATGSSVTDSSSKNGGGGFTVPTVVSINGSGGSSTTHSEEESQSTSESQETAESESAGFADSFAQSTSSSTTEFQNVDFVDNLSRNGVSFSDDTVERITSQSRKSETLKETSKIGPNAGVVRAALFLENPTINMPARISNVTCTLSFKTPSGEFLPVKTFRLRNEDWSEFEQDIYGDEELGPYTIEIDGLNTAEVKKALENGYMPQIHVVNYDISRIDDSNYNPGVDNLRVVEENAKGRTAFITVSTNGVRESYRVCAFDVDRYGNISPGISLKKALFNIYRSQVGQGEVWERDIDGEELTVSDSSLKWKPAPVDPFNYSWSSNKEGNSWSEFSTYLKEYEDENGELKYIEQIKSICGVTKYNPYNKDDNPNFDRTRPMPVSDLRNMKFWFIMHNGRYYKGDLNDPIWAGERYEIVCVDVGEFNEHFQSFSFTPMQSGKPITLDTIWNSYTQDQYFARSVKLGKVYKGDIINLEIDLLETRRLFNETIIQNSVVSNSLPYRLDESYNNPSYNGIPHQFEVSASGLTNAIRLLIGYSLNAERYEITLERPDGSVSTVTVTETRRSDNFGKVTLSSQTLDVDGTSLGILEAGSYTVSVKACGTLYGVDVHKYSSNQNLEITVKEAKDYYPGSFYFKVSPRENAIAVDISNGSNTEYYIIEVTGPLNPSYLEGGDPAVSEYVGYSGRTIVSPELPSGFHEKTGSEPAVYQVVVYPKNRYHGKREYHLTQMEFLDVKYEKFAQQKSLFPSKVSGYAMFESIDLEVNFNNGKGWYALYFLGDNPPSKYIDCRYTKYFDMAEQKFYVQFKAPDGGMHDHGENMFEGGRDAVDIYLRTGAKPKYRDRFWPYKGGTVFSFQNVLNIFSHWVYGEDGTTDLDYSDVSNMELVISDEQYVRTANVYDEYPSRWECDFDVTEGSLVEDCIFAPLEYKTYRVSTYLSNGQLAPEESTIDTPSFEAYVPSENDTAGSPQINVGSFESELCDAYFVYYKQLGLEGEGLDVASIEGALKDENITLWNGVYDADKQIHPFTSNETANIVGLVPNTVYAIAVIGKNEHGNYSSPQVVVENSNYSAGSTSNSTWELIPRDRTTPADYNNNFTLTLAEDANGDNNTVYVGNLFQTGATHYRIQYKLEGASWPSSYIEVKANPLHPVSSNEITLELGKTYLFRVAAYNDYASDTKTGSYSSELMIETGFDYKSKPQKLEGISVTYLSGKIYVSNLYDPVATNYEIQYKHIGEEWEDDQINSTEATIDKVKEWYFTASNLSVYNVRVRAVNAYAPSDSQRGEWSNVYEVATTELEQGNMILTIADVSSSDLDQVCENYNYGNVEQGGSVTKITAVQNNATITLLAHNISTDIHEVVISGTLHNSDGGLSTITTVNVAVNGGEFSKELVTDFASQTEIVECTKKLSSNTPPDPSYNAKSISETMYDFWFEGTITYKGPDKTYTKDVFVTN